MLNIPELLKIVKEWDDEVRGYLPKTGYWFAPLLPDTGEIDPVVNRVGDNRYRIARKDLQDWLTRIGLPYHSPHKFRHGYAVYAIKQAKDIGDLKAISQNLMHSDLKVTDGIYGILENTDVRNRITNLGIHKKSINLNRISEEDLELALQVLSLIKEKR